MKTTPTHPPGDESGATRQPPVATALHVIIAHDDYAAYVRAMRMLSTTFFGRASLTNGSLRTWRFEELGTELWRKRAVAEAPRADVIVVSMSGPGDLPAGVDLWLSESFDVWREQSVAVLALCEAVNDFEVPWRRKLREAATEAGLDFLEAGLPAERECRANGGDEPGRFQVAGALEPRAVAA